ncbi:hypothetical protein M3697_12520 [Janibacter melonis]|uniref:hypothetical protein n=1 Tax=Janibacter melonis TaxID=262209 RepID=UPI002042ED34|nr:hypothetical protein [Janibacter melonis]MCM3555921.1 hypothetical protein [Janibacter melonis]
MSLTRERPAVSVDELRRAYQAVQEGAYRPDRPSAAAPATTTPVWAVEGPVLPVIGCAGGAGSTVTALAIATAAAPSRLVECSSVTTTGLSAAPTAELGVCEGWSQGTRGQTLLERPTRFFSSHEEVTLPLAASSNGALTVLDVGWDPNQVLSGRSWLTDQIMRAPSLVAVTRATVPGLRRLEAVLALLDGGPTTSVAVIGPRQKKWPRALEASTGALTRALASQGRLVEIPHDPDLALHGPTGKELPTSLTSAATHLLRLTGTGTTTTKG